MSRDWHAWHAEYDDPASSLSRRLEVVRAQLRSVLASTSGARRLLSLCSGDGRDTLPVLAETGVELDVVLVERDEELSAAARRSAEALGLDRVEVRTSDAGSTDCCRGAVPADVLMTCGIFGNVTDGDVVTTVRVLPSLLREGAHVIWTRGNHVPLDPTGLDGDPSEHVREVFAETGFDEVAFVRPDDAGFRVGVHRWPGPETAYRPGVRMFAFV